MGLNAATGGITGAALGAVAVGVGTCDLLFDLSSSVFLPNFQKLRFPDFVAFPALSAGDSAGSAEDLEDAGKAPGRRGVKEPRDSVPPTSTTLADCSCCAVDILECAARGELL